MIRCRLSNSNPIVNGSSPIHFTLIYFKEFYFKQKKKKKKKQLKIDLVNSKLNWLVLDRQINNGSDWVILLMGQGTNNVFWIELDLTRFIDRPISHHLAPLLTESDALWYLQIINHVNYGEESMVFQIFLLHNFGPILFKSWVNFLHFDTLANFTVPSATEIASKSTTNWSLLPRTATNGTQMVRGLIW